MDIYNKLLELSLGFYRTFLIKTHVGSCFRPSVKICQSNVIKLHSGIKMSIVTHLDGIDIRLAAIRGRIQCIHDDERVIH